MRLARKGRPFLIQITMNETLKIAIQTKGRLNEESMKLVSGTGIQLISGRRKLISSAKNFPMEVLFLRDDDIPQTVADAVADVGIVADTRLDVLITAYSHKGFIS